MFALRLRVTRERQPWQRLGRWLQARLLLVDTRALARRLTLQARVRTLAPLGSLLRRRFQRRSEAAVSFLRQARRQWPLARSLRHRLTVLPARPVYFLRLWKLRDLQLGRLLLRHLLRSPLHWQVWARQWRMQRRLLRLAQRWPPQLLRLRRQAMPSRRALAIRTLPLAGLQGQSRPSGCTTEAAAA